MKSNSLAGLSSSQFKRAATIKKRIEQLEGQLAAVLNAAAAPKTRTTGAPPLKRRRMSAAARKRISEAAKARWAKVRAAKASKGK